MKKKTSVFDCEVAPNRAMVGFMEINTGKVKQFQYDESKKIAKYLRKHRVVGFNNKNYDDIIVTQMLNGANAKEIYEVSIDLVEGDGRRWDYSVSNLLKDSIDIMEVATGQASLKLYGARLNAQKLQDLPYSPHEKHSKKMWDEVMRYNVNDLELTKLLYETLLPQLEIRKSIGKQYGIDVMSRSDAQVAEDVFKKVLGITKKPSIDKPKSVRYKAPKYVKFNSKHLNELKERFEDTVYEIDRRNGKFKAIEWMKEKVIVHGKEYTVGIGGLHSNEKTMCVAGDLKNADISSMYPSLIINSGKYPVQLGEKWLEVYKNFRDKRLEIKHSDKQLSAMLKIFLNGSYGKLNSIYSILYAPHLMIDTTITGQLSLLMVIEALGDAGIEVVSANTDGVEYIDGTNKGQKIIDKLGKKMNLTWEHAQYKALYARDVNNYVAVYDGYVKAKGFFGEPSLSKNPEYPIVLEAVREHLLSGETIDDIIRSCKESYKFCTSRTVTGGALWSPKEYPNTEEYDKFIVEFEAGKRKDNKALRKRNEEYQKQFILAKDKKWYIGKVVRYYYSTKGKPMYYAKSGNKVPKSEGCRPMMQLTKKLPKDIDYDKYIELAHQHLKELGYDNVCNSDKK